MGGGLFKAGHVLQSQKVGADGIHVRKQGEKTTGPRIFQLPTQAAAGVGLTGRRHPPEVGLQSCELPARHALKIANQGPVGKIVRVDLQGTTVDVDRSGHLDPISESHRAPSDAAEKLK